MQIIHNFLIYLLCIFRNCSTSPLINSSILILLPPPLRPCTSRHDSSRVGLNSLSKSLSVCLLDLPGLSCTMEWGVTGRKHGENYVEEDVRGAGRIIDVKGGGEERELHSYPTHCLWSKRADTFMTVWITVSWKAVSHFQTTFICCFLTGDSRLELPYADKKKV